ncbi:MAG: SMP-30/gluconolactonase/LRE family protein [Dehalococcoidia bacterium]
MDDPTSLPTLSNDTFSSSITIAPNGLGRLSGLSFSGNGLTITLLTGTILGDIAWPSFGVPYIFGDLSIAAGAAATLPAGLLLKGTGTLSVSGALNVQGTAGQAVSFLPAGTSSNGRPPGGGGLVFRSGSTGTLNYAHFANVGKSYLSTAAGQSYFSAVVVDGASPAITNSSIQDGSVGILITNGGNPTLTNDSFTNLASVAILYDYAPTSFPQDSGLSIRSSGNFNSLVFLTASIKGSWSVSSVGAPVTFLSDITVNAGATLTFTAGTTTIVPGGIYVSEPSGGQPGGVLNMAGTAAQPVTITGYYGQMPGGWGGVAFRPGSTGTLNFAHLPFTGRDLTSSFSGCCFHTAVLIEAASPTITNTIIDGSAGNDVEVAGGGQPTLRNDTFAPVPNGSFGVTNDHWVSGQSGVNASGNWWGSADGPSGAGAGQGTPVSSGVNFTPFLACPPSLATCPTPPAEPPTFALAWGSAGLESGQFSSAFGVAIDSSSNVYVTDTGNNRVQKFSDAGAYLAQVGSYGCGYFSSAYPYSSGSVAVDSSGNVYSNGGQGIFRFDHDGKCVIQVSGPGSTYSSVAVDAASNIYAAGCDANYCHIEKFDSAGRSLAGIGLRYSRPASLTVDGAGNVYVAIVSPDFVSISPNFVLKFDSNLHLLTSWGTPGSGNGQFLSGSGISVDSNGNVYVSDSGNNRIQKFDGTGQYLVQWGAKGSGNGQFNSPAGVVVDRDYNVYVADSGNNRIQKFDRQGTYLGQWNSAGIGIDRFNNPVGMAVDQLGNVYVGDAGNIRTVELDRNGNFIRKWPSVGSGAGQYERPLGVAVDGSNNVYVADTGNNRIQKFASNGAYLNQWGNQGTGNGRLTTPVGIAADNSGNVYAIGEYNGIIDKFDTSGSYLSQWGGAGSSNGQFGLPQGIAADGEGNVYVADTANNRIQKFDRGGHYLLQWGSLGTAGGQFNQPLGIAIDAKGNIYVSDTRNNRIQRFTGDGTYLTQWGSTGSGKGQFSNPAGVAVDRSDNVYVVDTGNSRIEKFSPSSGPNPTPSPTPTASPSPSASPSSSPSATASPSPSPSATASPSASPSPSTIPSPSPSASPGLSPSPSPSPTASPTPIPLVGDVNGDRVVNSVDALCLLRWVAELSNTTNCSLRPRNGSDPVWDASGDGFITAVDALCILRNVAVLPGTRACPVLPLMHSS